LEKLLRNKNNAYKALSKGNGAGTYWSAEGI